MTSHTKMFLTLCFFRTDSRSYAMHQLFNWIGQLFEQLELSVRKKFASVWTARAIHVKKICIHSNVLGYLCEDNLPLFEWLGLSMQKKNVTHSKNMSTVWATGPICSKILINMIVQVYVAHRKVTVVDSDWHYKFQQSVIATFNP